jgi:hypothetical protein
LKREAWMSLPFDLNRNTRTSSYERTLHSARDHEAEERRAHAMDQLIGILAQAVTEELVRDAEVK